VRSVPLKTSERLRPCRKKQVRAKIDANYGSDHKKGYWFVQSLREIALPLLLRFRER